MSFLHHYYLGLTSLYLFSTPTLYGSNTTISLFLHHSHLFPTPLSLIPTPLTFGSHATMIWFLCHYHFVSTSLSFHSCTTIIWLLQSRVRQKWKLSIDLGLSLFILPVAFFFHIKKMPERSFLSEIPKMGRPLLASPMTVERCSGKGGKGR